MSSSHYNSGQVQSVLPSIQSGGRELLLNDDGMITALDKYLIINSARMQEDIITTATYSSQIGLANGDNFPKLTNVTEQNAASRTIHRRNHSETNSSNSSICRQQANSYQLAYVDDEEQEVQCVGTAAEQFSGKIHFLNEQANVTGNKNGRNSCKSDGFLVRLRTFAFILGTPLVLSPLLFSSKQEYKCGFCVLLMAIYWATEVMPLAVTAMLPVVLFPLTGILAPNEVAKEFLNDTNFLFIGSLIMATAVERCGIHERLALAVLTLVGNEPRLIMLSFMCITALLSMFISNTATTAMMLPIGQSIVTMLSRPNNDQQKTSASSARGLLLDDEKHQSNLNSTTIIDIGGDDKHNSRMTKGLILSIAFSANIGGVGTLTGTPPNLILVGMLSTLYLGVDTGINFLSWMTLTLPLMIVCLLLCWLLLCLIFFRNMPAFGQHVSIMMRKKNAELPPMSFAQKSVAICFLVLLFLWIGRNPGFLPGIGALFPPGYYTDATSAMLVGILLFLLPDDNPFTSKKKTGRLMDWSTMQQCFPWSVVLLMGGGFALAAGVKESGLSHLIAKALSLLQQQPLWQLQIICIFVTMSITNICSNTVTASIFIPIVASMAERSGIHPLVLMLPTTLACSFAFLLPVGTPPNAIAFSSGLLHVKDMIFSGLIVSFTTALAIIVYMTNIAPLILALDNSPGWATSVVENGTLITSNNNTTSNITEPVF